VQVLERGVVSVHRRRDAPMRISIPEGPSIMLAQSSIANVRLSWVLAAGAASLVACSGESLSEPIGHGFESAGSGPSTAGGGDTTSSSGSAGGSSVTGNASPSVCDGKSRKMTTGDLYVADFESGDMHGWYDYTSTGALNKLVAATPGAVTTTKAGHLAAGGLMSFGAGLGFGTGCWDTSALDGISFWAKGTAGAANTIQVQVAIPATHAVANGGDCVDKCFDHPSKTVTLTGDWKQYTVTFAELKQAGFGNPAQYQGVMMALNWASVEGPNVDFWIDEVALYAGTASPGAVGHH
jgi:hypothetical protein